MDSSGLPIPIGGSEPLSAVLLELSSRGLRLASVPLSSQTRETSFASNPNDASHASFGMVNSGLSAHVQNIHINDSSGNISFTGQPGQSYVQQNQSTYFDQQKTICENDYQMLLSSMKSSLGQIQLADQGFFRHHQEGQYHMQRVSPISSLPPMAAHAHINLLRQMEKQYPNHEKQVERDVLHAKSGVSAYKLGRGAERLNQYMFQLRNRPKDNNIQFWRNLVAEFFAPGAKKRWCVSSYRNIKQIDNVFKVSWQCNMCNVKPSCGFEMAEELLPRFHKIKYDIGILEEYVRIDTANEYQDACGKIYLYYPKAAEESEYEKVRIVRHGQLRIVFSPELKICSWEFCAHHHEEYIHRNSIIPQVSQLGAALQNYKLFTQNSSFVTSEELRRRTDMFISSAGELLEALGMPLSSQIGVVKQYEQCLQISEVLNIMHDLIDYSQENGLPPKESMAKFPRFGSNASSQINFYQQPEQQQSPDAFSVPYFEAFADGGSVTGFFGDGLGPSTSMGPNNHRKQRICSDVLDFSALTVGIPSSAQMDVFSKDAKSNYLVQQYNEELLDELGDFEGLQELLE